MVYGSSNKGNLSKLIKAISNSWFPPFPRIENKRSMIHVEDVVQCAMLAASNDISSGKTYIVSDGIDYSTRRLYEVIRKSLGKSVPRWGVPVIILIILAKLGDLLKVFAGRRILFDSDNERQFAYISGDCQIYSRNGSGRKSGGPGNGSGLDPGGW